MSRRSLWQQGSVRLPNAADPSCKSDRRGYSLWRGCAVRAFEEEIGSCRDGRGGRRRWVEFAAAKGAFRRKGAQTAKFRKGRGERQIAEGCSARRRGEPVAAARRSRSLPSACLVFPLRTFAVCVPLRQSLSPPHRFARFVFLRFPCRIPLFSRIGKRYSSVFMPTSAHFPPPVLEQNPSAVCSRQLSAIGWPHCQRLFGTLELQPSQPHLAARSEDPGRLQSVSHGGMPADPARSIRSWAHGGAAPAA